MVRPPCRRRICWHGEVRCSTRSNASVSNKSFRTLSLLRSSHAFKTPINVLKLGLNLAMTAGTPKHRTSTRTLRWRRFWRRGSPPRALTALICPCSTPALINRQSSRTVPIFPFPLHELTFKNISRISDNTIALALTARDNFTAVSVDNLKLSRWSLLTHPGFVTGAHKDANGLCTWIYAHQGVKIWGVLKPSHASELLSKEELFKLHEAMLAPYGHPSWDSNSDMYTVCLAPGDLLCVSFPLSWVKL
jgi:hypothetical protein